MDPTGHRIRSQAPYAIPIAVDAEFCEFADGPWHAELLQRSCANKSVRDRWFSNALLGCMAGTFCAAYGAGGAGAALWRTMKPR